MQGIKLYSLYFYRGKRQVFGWWTLYREQKLEENAFSYQEKLIIFPETNTAGFKDVIEATWIPLID